MQDDVSRLVGTEGLAVTGVVELTEQLEIEVELTLEAGGVGGCGRGSLKVRIGRWCGSVIGEPPTMTADEAIRQ